MEAMTYFPNFFSTEAIVHGTGIKNVVSMNLTLQTVEETVIPTSALAVIL